jgi:hypothetical protein
MLLFTPLTPNNNLTPSPGQYIYYSLPEQVLFVNTDIGVFLEPKIPGSCQHSWWKKKWHGTVLDFI